jgi:hypothetical protein
MRVSRGGSADKPVGRGSTRPTKSRRVLQDFFSGFQLQRFDAPATRLNAARVAVADTFSSNNLAMLSLRGLARRGPSVEQDRTVTTFFHRPHLALGSWRLANGFTCRPASPPAGRKEPSLLVTEIAVSPKQPAPLQPGSRTLRRGEWALAPFQARHGPSHGFRGCQPGSSTVFQYYQSLAIASSRSHRPVAAPVKENMNSKVRRPKYRAAG